MPADIPAVGLGTWQASDPDSAKKAIVYAIEEVGVRYIDTAHVYQNEELIGEALKEVFAKGKIKREDMWITTKLWLYNRRPERVEPACRASLRRLGLDYVDLYLIHWPAALVHQDDSVFFPKGPDGTPLIEHIDILDTWEAMEKLVKIGLTKKIGVSNWSIEMLERMEFSPRVTIQPYANQVEMSIWLQQAAMLDYCGRHGIRVTTWSPFATGVVGPWGTRLLEDPVLLEVAKEVGKTPGQVALKYLLKLSPLVNVIPKSVTPSRIRENFDLDFDLPVAAMTKLKARNCGFRTITGFQFVGYDVLALGI